MTHRINPKTISTMKVNDWGLVREEEDEENNNNNKSDSNYKPLNFF